MLESNGFGGVGEMDTEFQAEALAEVLRGQGLLVVVHQSGGLAGLANAWIVSVRLEDRRQALEFVAEVRERNLDIARLDMCPWCRYSLEGLSTAANCPECGRDLDDARLVVRAIGRGDEPLDPRTYILARGWLLVGVLACAFAGLVGYAPLREWTLGISTWSSLLFGLFVLAVATVVLARRLKRSSRATQADNGRR